MLQTTNEQPLLLKENNGKVSRLYFYNTKKAAAIFNALRHPVRWSILQLLADGNTFHVTEIMQLLQLEQTTASMHLALLRRAGVIVSYRKGRYVFYTLNVKRLSSLERFFNTVGFSMHSSHISNYTTAV